MSDEECCIICGESGRLYLTCGPYKTGPYCSQHRWGLGSYIDTQKRLLVESRFNHWVDEFQKWERHKITTRKLTTPLNVSSDLRKKARSK